MAWRLRSNGQLVLIASIFWKKSDGNVLKLDSVDGGTIL